MSGISYYTYFLSRALSENSQVSVLLMRRLIPRRLYPGWKRVGRPIMNMHSREFAPTFDGVNWTGFPSIVRALMFLRRENPEILVMQWWTAAVLPWYLIIAGFAKRRGIRIVLELHEDQDTGEARLPLVSDFARWGLRRLVGASSAYVVHSEWDKQRMAASLGLDPLRTEVIPHGPYDMAGQASRAETGVSGGGSTTSAPSADTTILFFGTIRPYKGLEHLVQAFDLLPRGEGTNWRLLVVGETWEGWTQPLELIQQSKHRGDICLVNRYVTDDEVPGFFAQADIAALPYLRSSASGPLAMTMSYGLPVVVTRVGGLEEAAASYEGAVFVPPGEVEQLAEGILKALPLVGTRHRDVRSWSDVAEAFDLVLASALATTEEAGHRPVSGA